MLGYAKIKANWRGSPLINLAIHLCRLPKNQLLLRWSLGTGGGEEFGLDLSCDTDWGEEPEATGQLGEGGSGEGRGGGR